MANDEWLDLVDDQDRVIGRKRRSQIYQEGLHNFRSVNGFLVNSQGQLWIPRRTLHKRIFPGGLDYSVAGHVESGESYEAAFERELQEELNLALSQVDYRLLGHLNPFQGGVDGFMAVYEIHQDATPAYNTEDFIEAFWWTPEQILAQLKQEMNAPKTNLGKLVRLFYLEGDRA